MKSDMRRTSKNKLCVGTFRTRWMALNVQETRMNGITIWKVKKYLLNIFVWFFEIKLYCPVTAVRECDRENWKKVWIPPPHEFRMNFLFRYVLLVWAHHFMSYLWNKLVYRYIWPRLSFKKAHYWLSNGINL